MQENALNVAADPAASITCLFPFPFLRESGGDDDSLPIARNFSARYAFFALLDTFPSKTNESSCRHAQPPNRLHY